MSEILSRRTLRTEVALVLLLSLGASGIWALLRIINLLTSHVSLASQTATMIGSITPDRPWLDLTYQLVGIALALVPVALVAHLLQRSGEGMSGIGFDGHDARRDGVRGSLVAAVVGGSGLGLYLVAWNLGWNVHLVVSALGPVWWAIPVLILAAVENAVLEETIVLGYLLHRLDQLGAKPKIALVGSSLLRGSYHLYQGLGGFFGNFAMGLIFGVCYRKWGRVMPLVIAHSVMDAVAFIGYQTMHGHVSWLP